MENLNFYIVTHFVTAAISLFVAFIVFNKNKKSTSHITLSLFSLSVFLWSISYAIWLLSNNEVEALFWARTLNLGATLIPAFLFHWIFCFLKIDREKRKFIIFYYILTVLFALFSYSECYIESVAPIRNFPYWPQANWLYALFLIIVWIPIFTSSFFLLLKEIKKRKSISRQQIVYVLIGLVIGFIGGSTNYFLVFGLDYISPAGSSLVVFFPVLFSYAIIRYRFMDIKLILRKSSVYILSLVVIFFLAFIIKVIGSRYLNEFSFWLDSVTIFLAVATFPYIKNWFFEIANKYFFTSLYNSQELILKTSNKLRSVLNIEKIYDFLYSTFSDNLHTRAFGVLDYNSDNKNYRLKYNRGFNAKKGDIFERNLEVENKFINKNKIVITEELENLYYNDDTKGLIEILKSLKVELLIPLRSKGDSIGLLVLGAKETEEAYNDEDLQVLEIISGQAAVAIENAQLYSEVKKFNIRLKREVKKAIGEVESVNADLTLTNKKLSNAYKSLKQLDVAKNEFISIASHQLRTPLTSIKGFVSLIMEGDYGKIGKGVREALRKIFISNERLIKLVNDLLSISRIESGKFTFNFKENDVVSMVEGIVDNFGLEAKNKKLKISYRNFAKKIEPFIFDRGKMQEVVSNLIDNAIKYTQKGEIKIKIEETAKKVRIIVSDSGKGMREDESNYIFEKFRRGVDSSNLNTEGTGLGLYVCKKIVDAHKGRIIAESDGPGKGSRFIIELEKSFRSTKK